MHDCSRPFAGNLVWTCTSCLRVVWRVVLQRLRGHTQGWFLACASAGTCSFGNCVGTSYPSLYMNRHRGITIGLSCTRVWIYNYIYVWVTNMVQRGERRLQLHPSGHLTSCPVEDGSRHKCVVPCLSVAARPQPVPSATMGTDFGLPAWLTSGTGCRCVTWDGGRDGT